MTLRISRAQVDSPSFPYASRAHPELAADGSWSGAADTWCVTRPNLALCRNAASCGGCRYRYSAGEISAVVAFAKQRFVEVVLEIDTPAHTMAVGRSHPEVMTDCWEWMATAGYKVDVDSDDVQAMDPTSDAARALVASLVGEAAALTPDSRYFHIGGDEVKFPCWNQSAAVRDVVRQRYGNLSKASFARLQAEWTANVSARAATAAGKASVLWQPTSHGPGDAAWDGVLPDDAVYMVWLNQNSAKAYVEAGSNVVYTTPYYVAGMGADGWLSVYNAKLVPDGLSPEARRRFLGGEVCAWGESLDEANTPMRAFQIGAGAAESFWREHAPGKGPAAADGLGLSERFNRFMCHLRRFGVHAPPIMPSHCAVVPRKYRSKFRAWRFSQGAAQQRG